MSEYFVVEPCATANGFEIKFKKAINLVKAEEAISSLGKTIASSPIVLLAKIKNYSVSVYASGRIMIKSNTKMSEKSAEQLAKKLSHAFEKEGAI
ncbi:hypothetical protein KKB44_05565 [Candidatus Micrarchaeota archaeon]|nr:hypothetical protein [Candidatus Micrarchaeota archaeon]